MTKGLLYDKLKKVILCDFSQACGFFPNHDYSTCKDGMTNVNKVLDEAIADLQQQLKNITKNSKLLITKDENEQDLKTLIISDMVITVYRNWVKKWFR
jgi:hypothetical protein